MKNTVYLWLHRFNVSGFETFERPTNPNGREPILTNQQVRELVKVALSRPADLGLPFTEWSTAKLTAYCKQRGLLPPITEEWVRRVAPARGGDASATQDLEDLPRSRVRNKKTRILHLYERRPRGGVAVCFDEWGPLELRPISGVALARAQHPRPQRATYRRTQGTEQFLGFYDVHGDCLMGICRRRKTARDILAAFRRLRACYPRRQRLYVIMDNLNTHRHPFLREFYRTHRITVVPTPTYASWLNRIESHLGAVRRFTVNGSDDPPI